MKYIKKAIENICGFIFTIIVFSLIVAIIAIPLLLNGIKQEIIKLQNIEIKIFQEEKKERRQDKKRIQKL